jgi:hypothetical protein
LTYFQATKGGDQNFLTKGGRQSDTEGRFKMEERFKPSIREETKTKIMRSLPRKEALGEKERGMLLLIKSIYIYFQNQYPCEVYIPTSLHPDLLLQKFMQMLILELLSQQKFGKPSPPRPTKKDYGLLQCT